MSNKLGSVAIDLDDTLNKLVKKWVEVYNERYNDNLKLSDIPSWDIWKYVKCGKEIYDILKIPGFFYSLEIQEYSQEVVKFLSEYFDLYVVTAFQPIVVVDKYNWVQENYPEIPKENIIFCNPKQLIHTNFMIDDGPHNLATFTGIGLLMDAHHNQNETRFPRCYNWLEIQQYFKNVIERIK